MAAEGRLEKMHYTGRFFETDNFGESRCKHPEQYQKYSDAIADVKNNQPGDPTDPKPRFANNLHTEVATELGLGDDLSQLRFYTAIGSALDHYHGVDGFFEFGEARVTMDITQNPAKEGGYKADIIVGPEEVEYEK